MKSRFGGLVVLPLLAVTLTFSPLPAQAKSDSEQICVSVGRLLEEGHYTHQPLNDEVSRKFLRTYLELLDFSHLFFTQQDVDALYAKYGTAIDDDVLLGNLKPAYDMYALYTKRVDARVAKIKELLKKPSDFENQRHDRAEPAKIILAEGRSRGRPTLERPHRKRAAPGKAERASNRTGTAAGFPPL